MDIARTKPLVALSEFQVVLPKLSVDQEESLNLLAEMHGQGRLSDAPLVRRYGVKPPKIQTRRFESVDIAKSSKTIEDRAKFFHARATEVFAELYPADSAAPAHLVHVTCTGYVAPSAAQEIVVRNKWSEKTAVSHAYHMGCYASLPAIRLAEGLVAAGQLHGAQKFKADVVHTEMYALHMNTQNYSPEQLVVQSLFADGHIKYSVTSPDQIQNGFEVLAIREALVPNTLDAMTWIPSDAAMRMTLSRDVPMKIAEHLKPFLTALIEQSEMDLGHALKNATFAVHPGGPKIIESVQHLLELSDLQTRQSVEVLQSRGNMSSATLPHVWHSILDQDLSHQGDGHIVISLAFGPGLTIFGSVFRIVRREKPR